MLSNLQAAVVQHPEEAVPAAAVAEEAVPAKPPPYVGFPLAENGRQITFSFETPEYDEVSVNGSSCRQRSAP